MIKLWNKLFKKAVIAKNPKKDTDELIYPTQDEKK